MATQSPILKERVDVFRDKKDDNSEKLQATVIKFQPCSKVKVTVMSFARFSSYVSDEHLTTSCLSSVQDSATGCNEVERSGWIWGLSGEVLVVKVTHEGA